ncbi:VRR-NUC domain-containing protein [Virgibacillus halodenitrificans]|uniref:VRR-NUC domain-containing protein n=1 Tax=Virgibacillus halodenitrificans TaxID=1482 RepID=UPI001F2CF8B6|nr:VRR-NUC domain-containing protein [Virgibacillus halodenitrificans]MCG1029284.1 VRR-NUC domain-containing protein [Virgibacillus halodenitrificans]
MGPEKRVENQIKGFLDQIGAYYRKTHGNLFSKAGTPDILACIKGRFVAIEVKREVGGEVSPLQKANIKLIREAGGIAFVAESLKEAKQYLAEFGLI